MKTDSALPASDTAVLIAALHAAADASATVILPHFRERLDIDDKGPSGGFDPVTAADRDAETAIRAILMERFPAHGIIGEEFPPHLEGAENMWLIDPIDGTRAFIMGLPVWGTLIGLTVKGKPVIGMMNQPFTGERFWADGAAAYFKTAQAEGILRTRQCARIADATLAATTPDMFSPGFERERFEALAARVKMRRFGGDCYAYCMLAMGFVDAVAEAHLKPFDIVPLIPIIEAAGGIVTGWDGGPAETSSRVVACGDARLHAQILPLLGG